MKTKRMIMVTLGLFAFVFFTQCNKNETAVASQTVTSSTIKGSEAVASDLVLSKENGIENTQTILECVYNCLNALPVEEISPSEIEAISFVREEEYLAHDVYQALYGVFPIPVFNNISNSEMIHAYAMKVLLDKYNLPDPAENHQPGVFTNATIQQLYDDLVAFGLQSIENALIVGATVEDLDIHDLVTHLENDLDNQDLIFAFEQLYKGSRNHLRAFNAHLTFRNLDYTPQYITQELYDEIVSTGWEIGTGFCICECTTSVTNSNKVTD
ncbi:MAG: hypothetical protein CVT92_14245 [Bacteroidetes bacterium HGW-Bacteroidetes-1]|jgi:hypothetical protein|nr:MAG: hypothetical protein CVT92_14245 [Bacteroidetes bacterium HGW-Bacteroidetes-1]